MTTEENQSGPRIVVAFQNYSPPFDAEKVIRNMLRIVPANYLWGIDSIVLTNTQALSHEKWVQKAAGRRRVPLEESLGYYSPWRKGQSAQITLLLNNLEKHWGRNWLRFGIVRDVLLTEVLYHEIGHHIHRLHIPEYDGKENVAEKWSKKLGARFLRRQYWYLMPLVLPLGHMRRWGKMVAKWLRRSKSKASTSHGMYCPGRGKSGGKRASAFLNFGLDWPIAIRV